MSDKTPSEKRATTRKIFKLINDLKGVIDFSDLIFVMQDNKYTGLLIKFDEPMDLDEGVKE